MQRRKSRSVLTPGRQAPAARCQEKRCQGAPQHGLGRGPPRRRAARADRHVRAHPEHIGRRVGERRRQLHEQVDGDPGETPAGSGSRGRSRTSTHRAAAAPPSRDSAVRRRSRPRLRVELRAILQRHRGLVLDDEVVTRADRGRARRRAGCRRAPSVPSRSGPGRRGQTSCGR